jgi:nucleoside-diphosphate kinase
LSYLSGSGDPVVCMCWQGDGAVAVARLIIGATDPGRSSPGTIRSDLAVVPGRNVIHGSDSAESADRELRLWFGPTDDVIDWNPVAPQVSMSASMFFFVVDAAPE